MTIDLLRLAQIGVRATAATPGVAMAGRSAYDAVRDPDVLQVPVELSRLPEELDGFSLVQLSDVHIGNTIGRDFVENMVKRANAANGDAIVITGDLIDFRDISESELTPLGNFEAPAYFIIGNHERYVDLTEICQRLTNLGIRVLRNESVDLGDIQLIGIDDAESKRQVASVLRSIQVQPDRFRVLLYHRPDGAADAARWGAHLMLCGHTHHGQIMPFNFVVQRIFPQIRGLYEVEGLSLYVSPGTGTWGPILRLGSRSEIGMIELN